MGLLQDIFGSKPNVPALQPIDLNAVQQAAIQANSDALPGASALASKYNALNQQQLDALLAGSIPDLAGIKKNVSSTLLSESKGELSPDVQSAVERSAVARSLGQAGGSMGGAWVARDIGKTSYQIANAAMDSTSRWLATTRDYLTPQPFNMASMFISPQQRLAQVTEERNMQFERSWLKEQIHAMPDPASHGVWQAVDSYIHSYYGGQNAYPQQQQPQWGGGNPQYAQASTGGGPSFNAQGGDPGMVNGAYPG